MIVCLRRRKCPLHSCADYILHFHNSKNETWGVLNVFILCWYKRNVKIWLEMFFKCNLDCKQRKYTGKHCIVILRMTQLLWACSVLLSFVLISTTSLWGSQSPPSPRGCWVWECGESSGTLKLTLFFSLCCSSLLLSTSLFSLSLPTVRQWAVRQTCWWANYLSAFT